MYDRYRDLEALLKDNPEAMGYYDSLSIANREYVNEHSRRINSFPDLMAMARKL